MKKLFTLLFAISAIHFGNAQGLENVIVEKYYKSDANDASVNAVGGVLPVGSVTYRVYLDMLPDYIFQSAYGDPNHECRIATTTLFFNNEDRGAVNPTYGFNYCDDNTVMLDSWLSVGAACTGHFGIMKDQDDGVGTVVNNDGVLLNTDPWIGIPLTQQDGLIAGSPEPVITAGIGTEIQEFDAQNDGTNGPVFSTFNGAWASLNGSVGPDPAVNQVLIMQITTDGTFSFSLNIQIRNQITLGVENYVASAPIGNEILFPGLNFNSDSLTSVQEPVQEKFSASVYPSPAKDYTTLIVNASEKPQPATLRLTDILGNTVKSYSLGSISGIYKHQVDLRDIPSGVYFLELKTTGHSLVKKIVKQ